MNKAETAQRVADSLFEFERALDCALARGAESVATATSARAELGVGIKIGAGAITKLTATLEMLAASRESVADAHDLLAAVQRKFGLQPQMVGGGEKGPNDDVMTPSGGSLRRVA